MSKHDIAIAYATKRRSKKKASGGAVESGSSDMNMAEGGEISANNERRPMPDNRYDDSKLTSHNSGNKPPKHDSWTDNSTIEQAQRPSKTKLSRPKLVGSDAFSVRYKEEIDEDLDRMSSMAPQTDRAKPPQRDNETSPNRQGPKVSDMAPQHKAKRPPYNKAIEDQYAQDMASAEMKKTQSYARGGPVMEPKDHDTELMERSDETHLESALAPSEDEGESDAMHRNERRPNRPGDKVPDMEAQHDSGRKPYYMGGPAVVEDEPYEMYDDVDGNIDEDDELNPAHGKHSADDSEDQPQPEAEHDEEDSEIASIMTKMKSMGGSGSKDMDRTRKMARGGEILEDSPDILSHGSHDTDEDADQVDLSRNADEDANEEDQMSFDALRKENYSESEGLAKMGSPKNSNLKGDKEESMSEDEHDEIGSIRRKMAKKRSNR